MSILKPRILNAFVLAQLSLKENLQPNNLNSKTKSLFLGGTPNFFIKSFFLRTSHYRFGD
jgi:hypothetical protein